MSEKTYTWTKQIYVFTTKEAEGRGWDAVKLAKARSNLLLTVPRRYFLCGTFVKCSIVFHLQMSFV